MSASDPSVTGTEPPREPAGGLRELVLVGGGHTHVQVLRRFAMEPVPRTRITLVVDVPLAVYSGMVPGFVAGQYRAQELEIDVVPLARRAGARVILSPAVGIDATDRRIVLADRPAVPYDVASIDIGSTVAGLDLPGVRAHAIPTRPIGRFVRRVDELLARARETGRDVFRVLVVGAGAGGVELAFALRRRLGRELRARVEVTLLEAGERILPRYPASLRRRVEDAARRADVTLRCGVVVAAVEPDAVVTDGGERLPHDALLWVTGARSHPLFEVSELPTDDRGFVLTRRTLQVVGHDALFAVGDCATLEAFPDTPKAGVYAVRQGPTLISNLRAALAGGRLETYRPQRDFLTLLNLGDGTAVGGKWGLAFEGRWVMTLKDWIDRRFMRRFQVLDAGGAPSEDFPPMDGMEMLCGGCAAKAGRGVLHRALERLGNGHHDPSVLLGLETPDDAAAVALPGGDVVVSSVDAFRAFTDDPYLVGRVAAVNAVSDVAAKGARPAHALALVALPETEPPGTAEETLFQVLAGMRAALDPLDVALVGGHTTTAMGLMAGLTVDGLATRGRSLLPLAGLEVGQVLILTKPLGTGVLFHADMQGLARGPWIADATAAMLRPNLRAARVARRAGATAVTDVTGFGLAGHLGEMLRASGASAVVDLAALPALPGALELLGRGIQSTFHPENARARRGLAIPTALARDPRLELLFDPQTSGGLLFGVAPEHALETLAALREGGDAGAAVIGRVTLRRDDGALFEVGRDLATSAE